MNAKCDELLIPKEKYGTFCGLVACQRLQRIDEKLLVEVAGIERSDAKFLCTDFLSYWRTPSPLGGFAAQGAERLAACLRSIWK